MFTSKYNLSSFVCIYYKAGLLCFYSSLPSVYCYISFLFSGLELLYVSMPSSLFPGGSGFLAALGMIIDTFGVIYITYIEITMWQTFFPYRIVDNY